MKKAITFIIIIFLCFNIVVSVDAANIVATGTCGDNLSWSLDNEGLLTISGTGDMNDYSYDDVENEGDAPWFHYNVKKVIIEDGVKSIGRCAFIACKNIEEVDVSDSVTNIGNAAFEYCEGIKEITIPEKVKDISLSAFRNCKNLLEFNVSEKNEKYSSLDGVIFDKNAECLILYPPGKKGGYTTPKGVTRIDWGAFLSCNELTEIRLSSDITNVGMFAFAYLNKLSTVWMSSNIKSIALGAFEGCENLKDIYYDGTETEWKSIPDIGDALINSNVKIHFSDKNNDDNKTDITQPVSDNNNEMQVTSPSTPQIPNRSGTNLGSSNNNSEGTMSVGPQAQPVQPADSPIKVSLINLKGVSRQIAVGKRFRILATVFPQNASNKTLKWSTSNKKIATVNQSGLVIIKKKTGGKSVKIIATAQDGSGKKAIWNIKVMKGVVKGIIVSGTKKKLKPGETLKLKVAVKATKGSNKKLKWTSSNPKWATVNAKGVVKALKTGKGKTVKITVMTTDGSNLKKVMKLKIQ